MSTLFVLLMQAIARLLTHYNGVHSRLCLDEAEVAEHITGITRSLAESPFKYVTCFSKSHMLAVPLCCYFFDEGKEIVLRYFFFEIVIFTP